MNRKVCNAWSAAQDEIAAFNDDRREDRQWDEIWNDAPTKSQEERLLIEAAKLVKQAAFNVALAYKEAKKRGGPTY